MKKLLLLLLVVVTVVMGAAAAAYHFFGLMGLVAAAAGAGLLLVLFGLVLKSGLKRFFLGMFEAKSKALRGAVANVERVTPAAQPPAWWEDPEMMDEEDDDDPDLRAEKARWDRADWYHLEVTISPAPSPGGFQGWEPGELMLVGPDAEPREIEEEGDVLIAGCELWDDGEWIDELDKVEGPQRLRLLIGVPPEGDRHRLQFRYYFELFGAGQLVVR